MQHLCFAPLCGNNNSLGSEKKITRVLHLLQITIKFETDVEAFKSEIINVSQGNFLSDANMIRIITVHDCKIKYDFNNIHNLLL